MSWYPVGSSQEESLQDLAVRICNRHLGVGRMDCYYWPSNRADLKCAFLTLMVRKQRCAAMPFDALPNMLMKRGIVSSSMVVDTLAGFIVRR